MWTVGSGEPSFLSSFARWFSRGAGRLLLQVVCSVTPKKIHSERMAEMFNFFSLFNANFVKKASGFFFPKASIEKKPPKVPRATKKMITNYDLLTFEVHPFPSQKLTNPLSPFSTLAISSADWCPKVQSDRHRKLQLLLEKGISGVDFFENTVPHLPPLNLSDLWWGVPGGQEKSRLNVEKKGGKWVKQSSNQQAKSS